MRAKSCLGKVVAVVIVAAAIGVFAQERTIDRIVAVVDNEVILESELYQYVQFQAGSPAALEAMSTAEIDSLKDIILGELIKQKVLLAKARADTVVVEERQVDAELDGRLKGLIEQAGGQDRLEAYYGMPLVKLKRQFRQLVEEGMMIDKVRQQKLAAVQVGPAEVQRFWEAYKDSIPPLQDAIRIAHVLLQDALSDVSTEAALSKADSARELIESGQTTFEEFASRYSDDAGSSAKGGALGQTNRGDLVAEYEETAYALQSGEVSRPVLSPFGVHLIRLDERVGEKISSSHILFKIVPTEEDRAQTQARADSILAAVRAGADFGELALGYSTDAKTAGKGGDLGWFAPAELPEDFAAPLANLAKGDLAGPIRTRFGVHVVRVSDRVFARSITFEQDYERIQRMALAKKQEEMFSKWIAELSKDTYIERK